jgi:hypothetical protein
LLLRSIAFSHETCARNTAQDTRPVRRSMSMEKQPKQARSFSQKNHVTCPVRVATTFAFAATFAYTLLFFCERSPLIVVRHLSPIPYCVAMHWFEGLPGALSGPRRRGHYGPCALRPRRCRCSPSWQRLETKNAVIMTNDHWAGTCTITP